MKLTADIITFRVQVQPKRNTYWPRLSVYLCACLSLAAFSRTRNVSECLYSLY